jgi:hypothetical protein
VYVGAEASDRTFARTMGFTYNETSQAVRAE